MSTPERHEVVLSAPIPQALDDPKWRYNFYYELWRRTGGGTSNTVDLKGLTSSVKEINSLTGVQISDSVQEQLDSKADSASLGTMSVQDSDSVNITGGVIANVTQSSSSMNNNTFSNGVIDTSQISIPINSTGLSKNIGGTLDVNIIPVGNVGAGEDTLIDYLMVANSLGEDSQYLEIKAWGTFAANVTAKRLKLKIGSTTIFDTGSVAANAGSWKIAATIVRITSTTLQAITEISATSSLIVNSTTYTDVTEDTATDLNIFCTGAALSNDDVLQKGQIIRWYKS